MAYTRSVRLRLRASSVVVLPARWSSGVDAQVDLRGHGWSGGAKPFVPSYLAVLRLATVILTCHHMLG